MACSVLALCHFCELHGPRVVLTCEVCTTDTSCAEQLQQLLLQPSQSELYSDSCEGCISLAPSSERLFTRDVKVSSRWYCSHRHSNSFHVASIVKNACSRSLSCEAPSDGENVMYFGDNVRGHFVSNNFALEDVSARGHQRRYSIIAMVSEKRELLSDWHFYCVNLRYISQQLQTLAEKVFSVERGQVADTQRNFQLFVESNRLGHCQTTPVTPSNTTASRSLPDITATPDIFLRLHRMFTFILFTSLHRFAFTGSKYLDTKFVPLLPVYKERQSCFDNSTNHHSADMSDPPITFVRWCTRDSQKPISVGSDKNCHKLGSLGSADTVCVNRAFTGSSSSAAVDSLVDCGALLRHICVDIGSACLTAVLARLTVDTDYQVVVCSDNQHLCRQSVSALAMFLPPSSRVVSYSALYLPANQCAILGVSMTTAIVQPMGPVCRLVLDSSVDMWRVETPPTAADSANQSALTPAFVSAAVRAVTDAKVPDCVLMHRLASLRADWLGKATLFAKYCQSAGVTSGVANAAVTSPKFVTSQRMRSFLLSLAASVVDIPLLVHWSERH